MERALGATAASRAEPDFPDLGVELKTLPVDEAGHCLESTFVCTAEVGDSADARGGRGAASGRRFATCSGFPSRGRATLPVAERRIGAPFFWQPGGDEEAALRADWELLGFLDGPRPVRQSECTFGGVTCSCGRKRLGEARDGAHSTRMGRVRWSSPKASTCAPGSPRASFVGICSGPEAVGLLVRRRICQNPRTMKQSAICLVPAFVFLGCNQEAGPAPKTAPAAGQCCPMPPTIQGTDDGHGAARGRSEG